MENWKDMIDQLANAAPYIGTALAGCALQALKQNWRGWRNFTVSAFSAGFGSWLIFQLTPDVMSHGWAMFASGMVGYSGGSLVDVAFAAFTRRVEKLEKKEGE